MYFLKHIQRGGRGVNQSTANNLVRGELGMFPLKTYIDVRCVNLFKYLSSTNNEILQLTLNFDNDLHKNGLSNSFI